MARRLPDRAEAELLDVGDDAVDQRLLGARAVVGVDVERAGVAALVVKAGVGVIAARRDVAQLGVLADGEAVLAQHLPELDEVVGVLAVPARRRVGDLVGEVVPVARLDPLDGAPDGGADVADAADGGDRQHVDPRAGMRRALRVLRVDVRSPSPPSCSFVDAQTLTSTPRRSSLVTRPLFMRAKRSAAIRTRIGSIAARLEVPVVATCCISCALISSTAPSAAASAAVWASVEKIAARPTWKNMMPTASSASMSTMSAGMIWPSWPRRRWSTCENVMPDSGALVGPRSHLEAGTEAHLARGTCREQRAPPIFRDGTRDVTMTDQQGGG